MNYLIDLPELLIKHPPFFIPNNPPIAISISYSPYPKNSRTKWKTVEQFYPNFKFGWKRETKFYYCKNDEVI
jgi:hypothetical protein